MYAFGVLTACLAVVNVDRRGERDISDKVLHLPLSVPVCRICLSVCQYVGGNTPKKNDDDLQSDIELQRHGTREHCPPRHSYIRTHILEEWE